MIEQFLKKRGIRRDEERGDLQNAIQAVSHIPWGKGRTIEEVLQTKKAGTCTGKHLVLAACLEALGVPHRTTVCTFHWSAQKLPLPSDPQAILDEGEWEHGHNFLQIENPSGQWIDVDITWDPALKSHGFRTFPEEWDSTISFVGLQPLLRRWDNADLSMKQEWLKALTPEQKERRERFLKGFFAWVESLRG